jgi:hypothetical protein
VVCAERVHILLRIIYKTAIGSTTSTPSSSMTDRLSLRMNDVLVGRIRGTRSWLVFSGPAVIASVAYMDPGNYATNIQAGAGYGYPLGCSYVCQWALMGCLGAQSSR